METTTEKTKKARNTLKGEEMKSKINTWLSHLWKMNKDESDKIICEIRSHLFRVREEAKRNYNLIKEEADE